MRLAATRSSIKAGSANGVCAPAVVITKSPVNSRNTALSTSSSPSPAAGAVGWVEQSDTRQQRRARGPGRWVSFTLTHPTREWCLGLMREGVGAELELDDERAR